jgi:hypothetical protein
MKSITLGGCYTCFCQLGNYHQLLFQNELTLIDESFAEEPSSLSCSTRPATVLVIRATPAPPLIEVLLEDIKNNTFFFQCWVGVRISTKSLPVIRLVL